MDFTFQHAVQITTTIMPGAATLLAWGLCPVLGYRLIVNAWSRLPGGTTSPQSTYYVDWYLGRLRAPVLGMLTIRSYSI